MNIAIDFDGTWTADPRLWVEFVHSAHDRGHKIYLATGRKKWSDDMDRAWIPVIVKIVFCGGELKEQALLKQGIKIDVWIDDMPGMIQDCRILGGTID